MFYFFLRYFSLSLHFLHFLHFVICCNDHSIAVLCGDDDDDVWVWPSRFCCCWCCVVCAVGVDGSRFKLVVFDVAVGWWLIAGGGCADGVYCCCVCCCYAWLLY